MNPSWRKNYLRYRSFFLNVLGKYREREDIRAYLEILLSLATISVFSVFALRPTLVTISSLIKDIESKEDTLEQMDNKLSDLTQARSLYNRELAKIDILRQSVPEGSNPEVLVRQIEGIAQENSINVTSFALGGAVVLGEQIPEVPELNQELELPEGSGTMSFSLAAQGDYPNLINLLRDVTNLRRPTIIESITFSAETTGPGGESPETVLIFGVKGHVPYLKKDPVPGNNNQ